MQYIYKYVVISYDLIVGLEFWICKKTNKVIFLWKVYVSLYNIAIIDHA